MAVGDSDEAERLYRFEAGFGVQEELCEDRPASSSAALQLMRELIRKSEVGGTTDFAPIKQVQLRRFKGEGWELFGPTLSNETGG